MDKSAMILAAEAQFAREVTLGVIVVQTVSIWQSAIPGMFLFSFLKRGKAVRIYNQTFMFPRKLAMDAALSRLAGTENKTQGDQITDQALDQISTWLSDQGHYSQAVCAAMQAVVDILCEHYETLLNSAGADYLLLIANAYEKHVAFAAFIERLGAAEKAVDSAISEKAGQDTVLKEKLAAERAQIEMRRRKLLEQVF